MAVITGTSGADSLVGTDGADEISGLGGNDTLDGGKRADTLLGGAGHDSLIGGFAADLLNGGFGADTMVGGPGWDTYIVDHGGDVVIEVATGGTQDQVRSSITYTLTAHVEHLTLTGIANIDGTGNSGNNTITGNSGNNYLRGGGGDDVLNGEAGRDTLDGGGGSNVLNGGDGNDLYIVRGGGDAVTEAVGGGVDRVQTSISYTLPQNVENLKLTGTNAIDGTGNAGRNEITGNSNDNSLSGGSGNDSLVGGDGIDTLNGGAGNDTLEGGAGPDTLTGGAGDDLYLCDGTEIMIEAVGEGIDSMMMTVGISAPDNIENMTYIGTDDNIGFDANGLDNFITGNALSQSMRAGLGNDTVSYAYETNAVTVDLGNETATGSGNDSIEDFENALGGAAGDTLIGSAVANLLDGRGGVDTMEGGDGDDTYYVDHVNDSVIETDNGPGALAGDLAAALDGFTDTVVAAVTYSLEDVQFVENLTLEGSATDGTGNLLNNIITGNNRANILSGLGGRDTIDGGAGNDVLRGGGGADTLNGRQGRDTCTGGGGADRFVFSTALSEKADQITDFSAAEDVIRLDNDIFTAFGSFVGELAAGRFISGPGAIAAGDAGDRIIYNTNTGALYYDADGTGGQETATRFATLTNQPAITAADFFIVS